MGVASREPSRSQPALTNTHQQHITRKRDPVRFQPLPLRATTVSLKPRPEATFVARNASTARFATTSRHLKTGYGHSVSSSTSPSSVWSDNARASAVAPSVRGAPYHRPAWRDTQGSIWSEDDFIEAYQAFFFPRPTDDHESKGLVPTLRSTPREPNVIGRQTDGGLELAAGYVTTPSVTDSAIATTGSGMEEQRPHDVRVTEVEGSDPMDWSIPHMVVTPIDPQRLKDLEVAAAAGYAHTLHLQSLLPSEVPETAYAAMHPSPPAARSSYSELAHA
ncbi:hypothetical protein GSI_13198 [Ganoderma sinense ZZ0214-1]|uniref:Uncharacterized protein n=1 Tax=Ganoderma sinense ZZ0214-1 TaxID=1077348 RepID=A0A2G8RUY7_9APHY|nr:hypothetical protein GSI_13198 [Ganoderma sinense ZZ0214-1]